MGRSQRLIAATVLIALSGALGGCASSSGWDPSDMLDFLDNKKKLAGDRKPVFPEGVPGLEQGVPKEMYKGAQQQDPQNVDAATTATALPPEPPRAAKSKSGKPASSASAAAPDAEAASEEAPPPSTAPRKKVARKRITAPPPDQSDQAQPAQSQQSSSSFPAPLPSDFRR